MLDLLQSLAMESFPHVRVLVFGSGEAALTYLRSPASAADVILSDFKMPGMDGIQFLGLSRSLVPRAHRVLVTAYADSSLEDRARREAEVDAFLRKPLDPDQLLELLRPLLG